VDVVCGIVDESYRMCDAATLRATEMAVPDSRKSSNGAQGLAKEFQKSIAKVSKKRKQGKTGAGAGAGAGARKPRGKIVLSYVVGVEKDLMVTEVTPRYMESAWHKVAELRCDDWWWDYCIKQVNNRVAQQAESATAAASRLANVRKRTSTKVTVDLTGDDDGAEAVTTTTALPVSADEAAATAAAVAAAEAAEVAAAAAAKRAQRAAVESNDMKQRVKHETNKVPTTLAAMKKSAAFCIKSQLGKYEMLRPDAKWTGAMLNGKKVYRRSDVATLHTAEKWKRHLRQVRADELEKPARAPNFEKANEYAKALKEREGTGVEATSKGMGTGKGKGKGKGAGKGKGKRGDEDEDYEDEECDHEEDDDEVGPQRKEEEEEDGGEEAPLVAAKDTKGLLYGEWQTDPWSPPPATAGKVPKNDHGNYEMWDGDLKLLPTGAQWLKMPKVAIVARQLGLDFAQVLTGFGRSAGRAVPTMEGIIVCQEHAGLLTEAYTAWAQKQVEAAYKKKEKKLLKRWTTLVTGILTHDRIRREYGQG